MPPAKNPQGPPVAVDDQVRGAVPHHAAGEVPHEPAHGGVRLSGPIVDRAGDGDVLNGAGDIAEQTVVAGPLLLDRHSRNRVAAAVKPPRKLGLP